MFLAADAVRFVPVDFRGVDAAILEPDSTNALALSPPTRQLAVLVACGDRLDVDEGPTISNMFSDTTLRAAAGQDQEISAVAACTTEPPNN